MLKSKTKYELSNETIEQLFRDNGITGVTAISPLGAGEFNAAYKVTAAKKNYVLKVAPDPEANVLTYEKDMMRSEIFWYGKMHEQTKIHAPEIYTSDFTYKNIKSGCFIMEMMEGEPLWAVQFSDEESALVQAKKIDMLTQIHKIHNDKFGYVQSGLHDTWYDAIRSMVSNLIKDCEALGHETADGKKLLEYIDQYSDVLKKAPCCMVNFDLWDSNVLYNKGDMVWIDPERSFWGDPIADFITLGKGQKTPLSEKLDEIATYNKTSELKVTPTKEECARYAIAVAYLALIEEVEKYVRYEPDEENYIRNTVDSRDMYDMAFEVLANS